MDKLVQLYAGVQDQKLPITKIDWKRLMKIKSSFVTNSSSTSFIVNDLGVKETALQMLEIIKKDLIDNFISERYITEIEDEIRFVKDLDFPDDVSGAYIETANYDTWIFSDWVQEATNGVSVNTCNNYNWNSLNRRDVSTDIDIDSKDYIDRRVVDASGKRITTRRDILIEIEMKYGKTEQEAIKCVNKDYGEKEENG